jgi:hypothetical protein
MAAETIFRTRPPARKRFTLQAAPGCRAWKKDRKWIKLKSFYNATYATIGFIVS